MNLNILIWVTCRGLYVLDDTKHVRDELKHINHSCLSEIICFKRHETHERWTWTLLIQVARRKLYVLDSLFSFCLIIYIYFQNLDKLELKYRTSLTIYTMIYYKLLIRRENNTIYAQKSITLNICRVWHLYRSIPFTK